MISIYLQIKNSRVFTTKENQKIFEFMFDYY